MSTHIYGIRHHGPGCARSLVTALEQAPPDVLLIEGPPDADAMLIHVANAEMKPPIALMLYAADEPRRCVFYPFAEFSPEWQAILWGLENNVPVRFMDLPVSHQIAMEKEEQARLEAEIAAHAAALEAEPDVEVGDEDTAEAAGEIAPTTDIDPTEDSEEDPSVLGDPSLREDPLGWLGKAAGYEGGEEWWEHMVEQRRDGAELFEAIAEAMTAVRAEAPPHPSARYNQREALREAHMRKTIRAAEKEGFANIAVVCGAWHVPALATMPSAASDAALLKNLPKTKIESTWIPWTYDRLAAESGYGAGVDSPAWYEHLWNRGGETSHITAWFARVAKLLRQSDLDCSSAHVIECVRLSEALAAMRDRPLPGLVEMMEAARTILTTGEDTALKLIRRDLIIGHRLGEIPESVPAVPLQRDLERLQKSLRIKVSASSETLELDLRKPNDLERSQLFYRLLILSVPWANLISGRSGKGTFKETWRLQWEPEFALNIIEASPFGNSVLEAASAKALHQAESAKSLRELTELISRLLLADLPTALSAAMTELENRSAITGDISELMDALTPMANVSRYGDVRQTDTAQISHVFDSLLTRICIGLVLACNSLDEEAAEKMAHRIGAVHAAVKLVDAPERHGDWLPTVSTLANAESVHHRVRGLAARILEGENYDSDTELRMSQALSRGVPPEAASAWLEGFLTGSGMILVHDDKLLRLLDDWVCELTEEHFILVLPLVRRAFANFPAPERRMIGERVKHADAAGGPAREPSAGTGWDEEKLARLTPVLRTILGIS